MSMEAAPQIEIHTHHSGVATRGQPEPSRFGCGPFEGQGKAMTIKAIETRYKGYRFRSRLEARWAVFFDALGIEWQYEPEGFERTEPVWHETLGRVGEKVIRYLPDFYLPQTDTWVEVKGVMSDEDAYRLEVMLDWGSPIPGIDCGDDADKSPRWKKHHACGLLILGEIPDAIFGITLHRLVTHRKGLIGREVFFRDSSGPYRMTDEQLEMFELFTGIADLGAPFYGEESGGLFRTKAIQAKTQRAYAGVQEAYAAARGARFEHGECGA